MSRARQAHLRRLLRDDAPPEAKRAVGVFTKVAQMLKAGRAGAWAIEVVGVETATEGEGPVDVLVPGDEKQGRWPLRVFSLRLKAGELGAAGDTIRIYVSSLHLDSTEAWLTASIAHEVGEQAPTSAFDHPALAPVRPTAGDP